MERLARRRGHALSWRSPAATLGLTAVLGAGIVGVAIGRDLWIGSDRALTIPLLLLADVVVLALMAVVVRAVRLGRGDLGLAPPGLRPAVIGGAVAVAMLIAAGTWPHWWRPGLAAPGVALVILAATVEEIAFRGVLFGAISRARGPAIALVATTLLFAIAHAGVYPGAALALVALSGALLGLLRLLTGSLAAPIVAHVVLDLSILAAVVGPLFPFLDSYQPPSPYRFVSPPPGYAGAAHANPSGGDTPVPLTGGVSDPASAFTDDGQVAISFTQGTFTAAAGQTAVDVRITPVAPQPPTPAGLVADGNAYLVQATDVPGGQPAAVHAPVLLDFRYPGPRPDAIYRIDGTTWTPVGGSIQVLLMTIDARTTQLGTFIAAHHAGSSAPPGPPTWPGVVVVGAAGVIGAIVLLLVAGVRIRRR